MALFHLSVTQTKRSAGQSAIASAAYRAGERLYSEYYGEYSDYTRKGGVICSDILLPSHAPPEYADRQTLSAVTSSKTTCLLIQPDVVFHTLFLPQKLWLCCCALFRALRVSYFVSNFFLLRCETSA